MKSHSLQVLPTKANEITHYLKEKGNGHMREGIDRLYNEAYNKGTIRGVVFTTLLVGGIYISKEIHKDLSKKKEAIPNFVKTLKKEEVESAKIDKDFPWEAVKEKMKKEYGIVSVSYDGWIEPLLCRAYKDRILLEFPSCDDKKIDFLRRKYKGIIKACVKEITGKNYIVTFVQPGEIIIEDDYE